MNGRCKVFLNDLKCIVPKSFIDNFDHNILPHSEGMYEIIYNDVQDMIIGFNLIDGELENIDGYQMLYNDNHSMRRILYNTQVVEFKLTYHREQRFKKLLDKISFNI